MLPSELKTFLTRLVRLARGQRGESAAFRPRLEVLETRAVPGALGYAEPDAAAPPSEPAVVRLREARAQDSDPKPPPALSSRPFDDRLFGDEPTDAVAGKDLGVLFAAPLGFAPAGEADGGWTVGLRSGKDDTAVFFAGEGDSSDVVFLDAAGW